MNTYQLGWFSTGRDKAARDLLQVANSCIKQGEIEAEIGFVFCNREPNESRESDSFIQLVTDYHIPLVCLSYPKFKAKQSTLATDQTEALPSWRLDYDQQVMNKLRGFKQQLEDRNEQLMAQATRFKEVLAAKGIDVNAPLDGAPPERNGNILQIDRPSQLVLVSIGYDEGLRKGHFLEVTRNGRYMGKLKVRNTEPDRSVAEILEDYSEGILQEGDRVDTTIE